MQRYEFDKKYNHRTLDKVYPHGPPSRKDYIQPIPHLYNLYILEIYDSIGDQTISDSLGDRTLDFATVDIALKNEGIHPRECNDANFEIRRFARKIYEPHRKAALEAINKPTSKGG